MENLKITHEIFIYNHWYKLDTCILPDLSCYETIMYDPETGEDIECLRGYNILQAEFNHNKILHKYENILWQNCQSSIARGYISNRENYLKNYIKKIA